MKPGRNSFRCLGPQQKSPERHFREVLHLTSLCDELGFPHVREVEGYFELSASAHVDPSTATVEAAERSMRVFAAGALERPAKL